MSQTLSRVATTPVRLLHHREPVLVAPGDALGGVMAAMREKRRGAVLVVDDATLVGIFTERDVLNRLAKGGRWHDTPVGDLMSTAVRTVNGETPMARALEVMHDGPFRHVAIVDADGKPTGILSVRDILQHVAESFPGQILNIPPAPSLEARKMYGG